MRLCWAPVVLPSVPSLRLSVGGILLSFLQPAGSQSRNYNESLHNHFCLYNVDLVAAEKPLLFPLKEPCEAHLDLQRLQLQTLLFQFVLLLLDFLRQLIDASALCRHQSLEKHHVSSASQPPCVFGAKA